MHISAFGSTGHRLSRRGRTWARELDFACEIHGGSDGGRTPDPRRDRPQKSLAESKRAPNFLGAGNVKKHGGRWGALSLVDIVPRRPTSSEPIKLSNPALPTALRHLLRP